MKKRSILWLFLLLAFFIGAGLYFSRSGRRDDAATSRTAAAAPDSDPIQALKEDLSNSKLSPEERERREMEFIAKHGQESLIGARDWDGKTDGLFPEERPVEARKVEIPGSAIWTGTDDTAPDGTVSGKPKSDSLGEVLPESTSEMPAVVRAETKKPEDPKEDVPAEDGRRKRSPSQLLKK